jgi:hypothetical protein
VDAGKTLDEPNVLVGRFCQRNQRDVEAGNSPLAKTDIRAYYEAMKEWGLNREKRFTDEGWRKMIDRRI